MAGPARRASPTKGGDMTEPEDYEMTDREWDDLECWLKVRSPLNRMNQEVFDFTSKGD